jgi:hypothetical protein
MLPALLCKFKEEIKELVGIVCEKTRWFRQNIVNNELKLCYYET